MSNFYNDTLLKEEFKLLQQVQRDQEVQKYIAISYEDQVSGSRKNISETPTTGLYPEKYFVEYNLPVFSSRGQLRNDFKAQIEISVNQTVLQGKSADNGPHTIYSSNFKPFNNHVSNDWICTGNAWKVAKDHGLWYYVLALGALINQDGIVTNEDYATAMKDIDPEAFEYWIERGKRPVTPINWPWDLGMRAGGITIISNPNPTPKLTIKKVSSENQGSTANKISIVKKTSSSSEFKPSQIKIIKKNNE